MLDETYLCSDNDGLVPVEHFNCMKINARHKSAVIGAPVETGQTSFDNKVIMPNEVQLTGIVVNDEFKDSVVAKIDEMFANRKFEFYSIKTLDGTWTDLILKDCASTIDKDNPDFIVYDLSFVEAMLVQNQTYTPANSEDKDTVKSGATQTSPSNATQQNTVLSNSGSK